MAEGSAEELLERITVDPDILAGKPVIKGTRISVELILELLANGWSFEQILENYPQLSMQDIRAAIRYAAEVLKGERVYQIPE
ncbi:MAG: DUF433 domain-containing protein [Aigarchaeota archaeon]|nr:DUF433 domain-containing protein [Candidatus Pelearchaeum maunauluense]